MAYYDGTNPSDMWLIGIAGVGPLEPDNGESVDAMFERLHREDHWFAHCDWSDVEPDRQRYVDNITRSSRRRIQWCNGNGQSCTKCGVHFDPRVRTIETYCTAGERWW